MSAIAIIPARGGSKRIPRKNIKDFCGVPIISYSIKAALESGVFDEVMVSTDSEDIAKIAKKFGAKVPFFRSEKASNDYATTSEVIMEVLLEYEKRGQYFDEICCIYPTAPFVTAKKINDAITVMRSAQADTVFPIVAYSYPPQRGVIVDENGMVVLLHPEFIDSRSQDLQTIYHDCGQFYFFRRDSFMKNKRIKVGKMVPIITSELEMQDIDSQEDWKIAEQKYYNLQMG